MRAGEIVAAAVALGVLARLYEAELRRAWARVRDEYDARRLGRHPLVDRSFRDG